MSTRRWALWGADGLTREQRAVLCALFEASGEAERRYVSSSAVLASALSVARVPPLDDLLVARAEGADDAPASRSTEDPLREEAYRHYVALVRLAQPFYTPVPLVEGRGHFGGDDGEAPADPRSTECRLTRAADVLLDLPRRSARLPMTLVLGSAPPSTFPPFTARAVARACLAIALRADAPIDLGPPNVPTGAALLVDADDLVRTGRGTLVTSPIVSPGVAPYTLRIEELPWLLRPAELVAELGSDIAQRRFPALVDLREGNADFVVDVAPGTDLATVAARLRARLTFEHVVDLRGTAPGTEDGMSVRSAIARFLDQRAALLGGREAMLADLEHLVETLPTTG